METKDAVSHLQNRLSKAMSSRISWSLNDRAAVSKLCIEAAEHPLHDDSDMNATIDDIVYGIMDIPGGELDIETIRDVVQEHLSA